MRKSIFLLISVVAFYFGNTQSTESNGRNETRETYLQKSKTAKSTGFVALGSGLALLGIAIATENSSPGLSTGIAAVGLVASIGSIPFFISAGKFKHKANLAITKMTIPINTNRSYALNKKIPAISLRISF